VLVLVAVLAALGLAGPPAGAASTVEAKYKANGTWTVSTSVVTDSTGAAYTLFYPTNLGQGGFKHPIITWGNGTNAVPTQYTATLTDLASWGFVVVASNSKNTGWGTEMWAGTQYMLQQNTTSGSIFYQKLNPAKVGAAGHSQGATGALNATVLSNGVITSSLTSELVDPFWFSDQAQMPDFTKLTHSVFLVSGTSDFLCSAAQQTTYYGKLPGPAQKAALKGGGHNVIQGSTPNLQQGYVTAWFMYTLQGDAVARSAFVGTAPEINGNTGWANQAAKGLL
jgi:hypothetical protein